MRFWRRLTGEARLSEFVWDDARMQDSIRLSGYYDQYIFRNDDRMNDDLYEYRYEQRGDTYRLRCWHNGTERTHSGLVDNRPEWLSAILVTAKVANMIRAVKEPPPEVILWFRTDDHHNLVEFIEMT